MLIENLDLSASEWIERAACHGLEEWFAGLRPPQEDELEAATRVCDGCPVRDDCATFADAESVTWGLWAGRWRGPGKHALTVAA